jgi:hypothetical protein
VTTRGILGDMKISHFFRSQGCTTALACCLLCLSFAPAWAAPQKTLYDGAKGTPPGSQGWIFFATGGAETKPQGTGVTTFSTTANRAFQGGYSLVLSSPLDRSRGYTLGFDIQIQAETHVSPDRAGVSVIVLGHDKKGLELGFWPSEVWAQTDKPLFRPSDPLRTACPGFVLSSAGRWKARTDRPGARLHRLQRPHQPLPDPRLPLLR